MTVRIHFTTNGTEDSIVVDGESVDEIRTKAEAEIAKRGGTDPWSEQI